MTGFLRSLRAELFGLLHRRSTLVALILVFVASFLGLAVGWLEHNVLRPSEEGYNAHLNFWPRFGQAAHAGFWLVEILTLVMVGGLLAREIQHGAARDPVTRRISRSAFVASRAVAAMLFPLLLTGWNLAISWGGSALLFEKGHIVTDPVVVFEDPEAEKGFQVWLQENQFRADDIAAWRDLVQSGEEEADAARQLGLEPFSMPPEYDSYIPNLVFYQDEVAGDLNRAILAALPSLLTLSLFAFCVSVLVPSVVVAAGAALGIVLVLGRFMAPEMGEHATWLFADWLPALGHESQLAKARQIAEGYSDVAATEEAWISRGYWATLFEAVALSVLAWGVFRRRAL
ncbi:MAG: hypothetical protein DWQ01_14650 [Planctomycetota bacterium]|nr:MAG: hypothetical protein DWQ01_14650 [Planctomycetota bacterium]